MGWLTDTGLVTTRLAVGTEDLDQAILLREAIYRLATAKLDARRLPSRDVKMLNDWAAQQTVSSILRGEHAVRQGTVTQVLASLARSAVELLGSSQSQHLKECDDPECTRLYVDRSRGQRRRWCGMDVCGNRVKAAEYRKRQRSDSARPGHA
jgi:predicted RNA-binding Zn ribbon-like protein